MLKTTAKELRKHVTIRPGVPSDDYGFPTIIGDYKNMNLKGKTVMDLGGNIGAFAVLACLEGCHEVHTYEPDAGNFELLVRNTAPFADKVWTYDSAVVDDERTLATFYRTNGASQDGHSTIPFRGREAVIVASVNFYDELIRTEPDVVKMDIEGEEWFLLAEPLPHFVKEIVVELHFSKKAFRESFEDIVAMFSNWTAVREPKNTGKNFHTIGHWRR
jgi:FkbM family methyltransferase